MYLIENTAMDKNERNAGMDLKEFIAGVDDVTDPSSMDKLLDYVEQLREKDEKFIELLTNKCEREVVYWEQPWYQQQQTRISNVGPKLVAGDETEQYRTDAISLEEHELIEKNWRKFRKRYKLPDQIISLARWKNYTKSKNPTQCPEEKARRFAVAFLSRGLKRATFQVFAHIASHFGGYKHGHYDEMEQKIIEICFYHKPKLTAAILSLVLGRRPRGIYKRLSHLTNGKPAKKKLKWTLPLATKLLQQLLKYTELDLDDLKNRQFETWVWRRLEEDMEQYCSYLHHFWYCYLHVQLFVRHDVKLHKLKKKIFKKLQAKVRDSSYKVWSDIRWKDILLEFPDGFTHRFLYRICRIFIKPLKGYLRMPLERVVEYALQKIKKQKGKKRNKRLRTLRLNDDGQLEVVDYRI